MNVGRRYRSNTNVGARSDKAEKINFCVKSAIIRRQWQRVGGALPPEKILSTYYQNLTEKNMFCVK